jgi:transcriptional regulator with XRE-family HTH domain
VAPTRLPDVLAVQERTGSWLARRTRKSASYVSKVIDGTRRPSADFKAAAASALGVPADVLFPEQFQAEDR